MKGKVKWFNNQRGYGFITDLETKEDVFVHYSQIQMDGFKTLQENDIVGYELGTGAGKDGREQAINVQPMLTRKMIEDSLKEENLHLQIMKDGYGVTKYQVINQLDVIQAGEKGMTFIETAAYAGFDTEGLSA